MKAMVEVLYKERQEQMKHEKGDSSKDHGDREDKGKQSRGGDSPPKTPPSPSPPFKSTSKPIIKLDVKFELPKYYGELDAEKLDDWVQQVEVYCRIQGLVEDASRIQLATLRLGGIALTWWESRSGQKVLAMLMSV